MEDEEKKDRKDKKLKEKNEKSLHNKNIFNAISNAASGINHVAKTEKNIQRQLIITIFALILGLIFKLTRVELVLVIFTIVFVMVTEMVNTAIEATVDLVTEEYHPKAKIAKDVAAGAVVLSTVNAIVVAYFLFFEKLAVQGSKFLKELVDRNETKILLIILLTFVLFLIFRVIVTKIGKFIPSGQAMIATSIFTAIWTLTSRKEILTLTLILLVMIGLNRISTGEKSISEVVVGSIIGVVATVMLFALVF